MTRRPLRIGDRVRCKVGDVLGFVDVGQTGLVVNVVPVRYGKPAQARVVWDNETVSMISAAHFERIAEALGVES